MISVRTGPQVGRSSTGNAIFALASKKQFSPLCDLHHTSMKRAMLEEDPEEVRSYLGCNRRGLHASFQRFQRLL
jgi:hypothetical protein